MQKIIDGLVYDTATAQEIADISGANGRLSSQDFDHEDTRLYRTPSKTFFVSGHGGARTRWRERVQGGYSGGSGLQLITVDEARQLYEQFGDPSAYAEYFGKPGIG